MDFAIVLPVFLLIIGAAIDLGRLFNAYVSIEYAANVSGRRYRAAGRRAGSRANRGNGA